MLKRHFLRLAIAVVLSTGAAARAGVVETVAGTGKAENNGTPGPSLESNIGQPFGVEIGPGGALYVTEIQNHRVWRVDLETGKAEVVAGNGKKGYSGDGGPATKAELNEPYEVRFDDQENMFFVEMQNHVIRRVDAKTGVITTVAGTGEQGFGGDGGPATKAKFHRPHSIALDGRGGIYVADIGNHRVRRIDLESGLVETVAGTGERKLPQAGKKAAGAPILGPRALYFQDDVLWIALREGHSIWKMNVDQGTWEHVGGTGKRGFSGDGGPAAKATFDGPKGIALGPDGNLYVADTENQTIRKIDVESGIVTTIGGRGPKFRGFAGDGGPATQASFDRHHGICVGPDGSVYTGDTNNHRVRVIRSEQR